MVAGARECSRPESARPTRGLNGTSKRATFGVRPTTPCLPSPQNWRFFPWPRVRRCCWLAAAHRDERRSTIARRWDKSLGGFRGRGFADRLGGGGGGDLGKSGGDRRCGQPDNWWGSRCDCGQSTRGGTHDSPERRSDGGHCPRARSSAVRGGRPRQDYVGRHPRPGGPRRNSRHELLIRLNRRSGPDRRRGPVRKVRRSPDCA